MKRGGRESGNIPRRTTGTSPDVVRDRQEKVAAVNPAALHGPICTCQMVCPAHHKSIRALEAELAALRTAAERPANPAVLVPYAFSSHTHIGNECELCVRDRKIAYETLAYEREKNEERIRALEAEVERLKKRPWWEVHKEQAQEEYDLRGGRESGRISCPHCGGLGGTLRRLEPPLSEAEWECIQCGRAFRERDDGKWEVLRCWACGLRFPLEEPPEKRLVHTGDGLGKRWIHRACAEKAREKEGKA